MGETNKKEENKYSKFSLSCSQNAEDHMNLFTKENIMPSMLLKIKDDATEQPKNNSQKNIS